MESLPVEKIQKIQPKLPLYIERAENINPSKPVNVVILFGWTNSSLKNVSKVASYWRKKRNFHIFYYVAPSWPYTLFPSKAEKATKEFIPFLQEWGIFNEQQKTPLLIAHCFSNGGAIGMAGLVEACKAQSLNLRYSAMIMDSTPGSIGPFSRVKVYTATLRNPISKFFGIAATIIGLSFYFIFLKLSRNKLLIDYIIMALRKRAATNCPRLFIYSKNDEIVPYKKIQEEIKISKDLGIDTDVLSFENSAHMRNWVDNKRIYEEKIDDFLSSRGLLAKNKLNKL